MVYAENKGERKGRIESTQQREGYPYAILILSLYYPYSIRIVGEGWSKGTRIVAEGWSKGRRRVVEG